MKRFYGHATLGLLVLVVVTVVAWKVHRSRTFQLLGELVPRVETTEPVVALTFDDGPTPQFTERILAILDGSGVRVTFFVVGSAVERYPEQARLLVDAGHELGNHSYSHEPMVLKGLATVRTEVERTDRAIRDAGYTGPIHFRAPYGKRLLVLPYYLSRTGRTHVMWDVEPESYPDVARDSARIVEHVVANVRPGSIVLLHPFFASRSETVRAVPAIIEQLERNGYRFVTVSELLARRRQNRSDTSSTSKMSVVSGGIGPLPRLP